MHWHSQFGNVYGVMKFILRIYKAMNVKGCFPWFMLNGKFRRYILDISLLIYYSWHEIEYSLTITYFTDKISTKSNHDSVIL